MKITSDELEISADERVKWEEVKVLRLHDQTLALVLLNGETVQVGPLHPSLVDRAFRAYENYLRSHPALSYPSS